MDRLVDLLSKLVSIPSVNPMGREVSGSQYLETKLTDFLSEWLEPLDLEVRRQPVCPGRDNLLVTYHSPKARSHILLEVHQDTVPVEGMAIEPFSPKVESGRLYGRGACDNKGPMTAMMLALRRLALEKPTSSASVTLAFSVDEEHTFLGVRELVRQGLKVDGAIVAEPTSLDIVIAHKGIVRWEVITGGRACHSCSPTQGVNAIYRMAPILSTLEQHARQLSTRPSDSLLGGPTLSVGLIEGGICVNIVPDACRIEVDRRLVPGETPEGAHGEITDLLRDAAAIDFEPECRPPHLKLLPLDSKHNGKLAEQFGESIRAYHHTHEKKGVAFGTNAAPIAAAGIASIVFGPGNIDQAHTKDEWISLEEIRTASEIYYDFVANHES